MFANGERNEKEAITKETQNGRQAPRSSKSVSAGPDLNRGQHRSDCGAAAGRILTNLTNRANGGSAGHGDNSGQFDSPSKEYIYAGAFGGD